MKKRILFIDQDYEYGGAQKVLLDLIAGIDKDRFTLYLLTCRRGVVYRAAQKMGVNLRVISLPERVLNVRREDFGPGYLVGAGPRLAVFAASLTGFILKNRIDILFSNTVETHILGSLSAFLSRRKIFWRFHDIVNVSANFSPGAARLIRLFALVFPEKILCVSEAVRKSLSSGTGRASGLRVVYNGVRESQVKPRLRKKYSIGSGKLVYGWAGRISRVKAPHIFIRAAGILNERADGDFFFAVAGDAPEEEKGYFSQLKEMAETAGLRDRVFFTGYSDEPLSLIKDFDILVHTSVIPDSLPTVIIEALSCGVTVIASDTGGVREIITQGESGFIYPAGDAETLGALMEDLCRNPEKRKAAVRGGRRRAEEIFSYEKYIRNMERELS